MARGSTNYNPTGTTPLATETDGQGTPALMSVVTVGEPGTNNNAVGGLTEAAPASDTASSGLNGRLQRIAQRLTSIINLIPVALVGGRFDTNLGSWFGSTAPTVGQKAAANSIPAVLASDHNPVAIGISPVESVVTPTLSAPGTYQSGDYVGQSTTPQTMTSVGRVTGGFVTLQTLIIADKANQQVPLELWLFNATFTAPADNAAWAVSDTDALNCIGVIPVNSWYGDANNAIGIVQPMLAIRCAAGATTIYYALVTRGAPVYANGDLQLRAIWSQDN